ncbi:hypothetical protein Poli38472_007332 [Pythium oligandrum]|uniref:Multiple inositol polyphosphate phosphatase 1 n=1 Tax=Pythium oligandrum TaxID=41045 RepID=A0A8K1CB55_PYTOL|nr:hypothetical protein Poli38472_007332 [Pythium oligandrum]|eukprot:TMW59187.1 hypothetical protein Poli38472_007332 [Pythium oligandrum]
MAFASTFFDNPLEVVYDAHTEGSDRLLRFFDECPRYQREVKDKATAAIELTRYVGMKGVTDNIKVLRAKLNLPASADLNIGDVQTAYSACSFDLALNDRYDNWCSLMTEEMVKEVEFGEDLETFYEESHGYKINYEIASVLLKDIHQNIMDLIDRKSSVVGNFRFAHGETTMPLLTLLGFVDKTRLTADMPPREIDARKFRTSRLALFMANIEFRLYKKRGSAAKYAQVRVNEQPMKVPGCDDSICDLKKFEIIYKKALTSYNFDKECAI